MGSLLDIVVGTFIGSFLLLLAVAASDRSTQEFFSQNSDAIIQANLTRVSKIMQYDLRKMGFGVPEAEKLTIVQKAESKHLKFLAHLNLNPSYSMDIPGVNTYDNVADTIEYVISLSDSFQIADTTVMEYAISRSLKVSTGVIRNSTIGKIANPQVFRFLDQNGNLVTVPASTAMVEVTLTAHDPQIVLTPELVRQNVSNINDIKARKDEVRRLLRTAYWRQTRLVSRNLRR